MPIGDPPFKSGDKSLSHAWLNDLERARSRVLDRTGGFGPDFGVNARITVLVTQEPVADDRILKVRRVSYRRDIPELCDEDRCYYAFASDEFSAYVDIGVESATEYESWSGVSPLAHDEPYLKAYREDGTWRLEKPGGIAEIDDCVIFATADTPGFTFIGNDQIFHSTLTSTRVIIQRVHFTATSTSPRYVSKGDKMVVGTRPNVSGKLYHDYTLEGRNSINTPNSVYFIAIKRDGLWRVEQTPPLMTRAVPSATQGGCVTQ